MQTKIANQINRVIKEMNKLAIISDGSNGDGLVRDLCLELNYYLQEHKERILSDEWKRHWEKRTGNK